uniref:CASP-like protein n=1 Tax=Arundo donax TaxID=35708 RepID=A0A0A9E986_ARUDO
MDGYLEQAKKTDDKPDEKPPSADDDVLEELKLDPEVPRDVAPAPSVGEKTRTLSVGLRVLTAVVSLMAFSIMASASTSGGADDHYGRYLPYRYAIAVNVIVCFYSMAQAFVEIRRLVSQKLLSISCYCVTLFLDQVLAYLLVSASSEAASRKHLWVSRFGKDRFNDKISFAVGFSFLGFFALSANTLISMANLFSRI